MTSAATVGGDERLRLFCALRLPDDVVRPLAAWQSRHLSGGRIVPPEHLHVTTAFLGWTPARELARVCAAVRDARRPEPIRLRVERYRETSSVGMLVLGDEDGRAAAYAERLQRALAGLGLYEPERRQWTPHVTVLRFRERPRLRPALPELGTFAPSDAAAYLSRPSPAGARYEVVESFELDGSG
jgi:2'-5' RNA ligase